MNHEPTSEAAHNAASLISSLVQIARQNGLTTLQAFADKAGMKRAQLSRYANQVDSPTLDTLLRLADAAGAEIKIEKHRGKLYAKMSLQIAVMSMLELLEDISAPRRGTEAEKWQVEPRVVQLAARLFDEVTFKEKENEK